MNRYNSTFKRRLGYEWKRTPLKRGRYGLRRSGRLKAGPKTKAWNAERRKLKADSERNNRTTCELRGVIEHECSVDNLLGYAHPAKRRKLAKGELSIAILVCNPVHDLLERMPPAEMKRIVYETIERRVKADASSERTSRTVGAMTTDLSPEGTSRMTFKEKAIELLINNGMFKEDAEKVFERVKSDPTNEPMAQRWNDDVVDYPPQMINVLWLSVKRNAAEWIAEHQPHAWYRPLFDKTERAA